MWDDEMTHDSIRLDQWLTLSRTPQKVSEQQEVRINNFMNFEMLFLLTSMWQWYRTWYSSYLLYDQWHYYLWQSEILNIIGIDDSLHFHFTKINFINRKYIFYSKAISSYYNVLSDMNDFWFKKKMNWDTCFIKNTTASSSISSPCWVQAQSMNL